MTPRAPKRDSAGFTLVEVLIATVIMVVAIVTVTAAFRQFTVYKERIREYEGIYLSVLSIRDMIENEPLADNMRRTGKINGLGYQYVCRLAQSANNYVLGEERGQGGNRGMFAVMLYRVTINISGRDFEVYKTEYKIRPEATPD